MDKSWKRIVEEFNKCVMVCGNCHSEIHDGITVIPKDAITNCLTFEENSINVCSVCGIQIYPGSTHCKIHAMELRRKVERPEKQELRKLVDELGFVAVGKMFNVSDNAIRKWLK